MDDLSWREAVEEGAAGGRIRAHVLCIDEFAQFHVGQLLGQADSVESVACGTEDRADLRGTFPETFEMVLAMVEDHAAVGVIDTVIEVVAKLATADGLADDLGDSGHSGSDQKPPRLSENFDGRRKKTIQLGVNRFGQAFERGHRVVVVSRKAATDVEQLEIKAAGLGFGKDAGGQVQRLDVVLHVGALAADVEAQSLHFKLVVVSEGDQVY